MREIGSGNSNTILREDDCLGALLLQHRTQIAPQLSQRAPRNGTVGEAGDWCGWRLRNVNGLQVLRWGGRGDGRVTVKHGAILIQYVETLVL